MKSEGSALAPWGLAMAGGMSRRMGHAKASLVRSDGSTWLEHGCGLLEACCEQVWVSVREEQRSELPRDWPMIVDRYTGLGPAAGLLSAWDAFPERPWLVLAIDMPRVTVALLERLLAARGGHAVVTGLRHPDGIAEPLCTVWEPAAADLLRRSVAVEKVSLSRLMARAPANWVSNDDPGQLTNVNTPAQRAGLGADSS